MLCQRNSIDRTVLVFGIQVSSCLSCIKERVRAHSSGYLVTRLRSCLDTCPASSRVTSSRRWPVENRLEGYVPCVFFSSTFASQAFRHLWHAVCTSDDVSHLEGRRGSVAVLWHKHDHRHVYITGLIPPARSVYLTPMYLPAQKQTSHSTNIRESHTHTIGAADKARISNCIYTISKL